MIINKFFRAGATAGLAVFCLLFAQIGVQPVAFAKSKTHNTVWGFYPTYPKIDFGTGPEAELAKKGEYLAKVGDCIACHTDTSPGGDAKPFAGGLPITTPFGNLFGPNITPDKETGIGTWTEKDFFKAIRHGKRKNGANLFPVFPYPYFNKISDNDIRALWAYLKKLPAVKKKNRPNELPFPFNIRFAQYGWKLLYFYPYKGQYKYDPSHSKQWNRGAYLVQGLGHCAMCHTPINLFGAPKRKYDLTGAFVGGFWAPNITALGLEEAPVSRVVDVFKEDKLITREGKVVGPMSEVNHNSLNHLTKEDLYSIATYLKTVESKEPLAIKHNIRRVSHLNRGKKVYNKACTVCHQQGQLGAPRIGDHQNWGIRMKKGKSVLYKNAYFGYNQMPFKGACVTCDRRDIEAAVDFLLYKSLTRTQLEELARPEKKPKTTAADGALVYKQVCSQCHETGKKNVPKMGDKAVWKRITKNQFDVILENVLHGKHHPPKGGCHYCNTADVIEATKYMLNENTEGDYSLW